MRVKSDLFNGERCVARIRRVEDLVEFLERAALSLDEEEEGDHGLNEGPTDKHEVRLPPDILDGNGQAKLVDHERDVLHERGECHALCALLVRQDLHRVESLQGRDAESIRELECENHEDGSVAGTLAAGVAEDSRADRHENPPEGDAEHNTVEELTPSKSLHERGSGHGKEQTCYTKSEIDVQDNSCVGDTCGGQEGGQEVGRQAVTRPLAKDGERHVAEDSVSRSPVLEERAIIPPTLITAI